MKLSKEDVSNIENNKREVSKSELRKFSKIYGLSIGELLQGKKTIKSKFTEELLKIQKKHRKNIINLIDKE